METMYYTTSHFVRHPGNVVDLSEYRRKLAMAEGNLAPVPEESSRSSLEQFSADPVPVVAHRRSFPRKMSLENWASLGILFMTVVFTLRILVL